MRISLVLTVAAASVVSACAGNGVPVTQMSGSYSQAQSRSISSGATPQQRADKTYGNQSGNQPVSVVNDTTVADAATGSGGQQAGDEVPTSTVTQDAVSGTPAGGNSGGAGAPDSGVTESGNNAPGFE